MSRRPTREALGDEVVELGRKDPNIVVIDCDVSKSCKTKQFANEFPNQHLNVGIAEQDAVGIAAGLSTTGKIPFVVTYAVFASMRALEQIRQSVCYPNLNVKFLCSHGGLTPANDGGSHQCIEDMGILRTIPNMTVVMPADYNSAKKIVAQAAEIDGPIYVRFTRDAVEDIYDANEDFQIGKAKYLRHGKDLTIIANGDTVSHAKHAADELVKAGIDINLIDMHTIKPLDRNAVIQAAVTTGKIITVEDHNVINGLGSAVSDVIAEIGEGKVAKIGINDHFGESAPYERLLEKNGISTDNIIATAKNLLE